MKQICIFLFSLLAIQLLGQSIDSQKNDFFSSSDIKVKAQLASDLAWSLKDINPDSSLFFAREALRFSLELKDHTIEAYSLADIGNYFKRKENYQKANNYYRKSLEVRLKYGKKKAIVGAYIQIGLLYRQWEKYDTAVYYFNVGLKKIHADELPSLRMKLLDGLGMSQYHKGDFQNALRNVDSSRILSEQIKDTLAIAQSWQNIGTIHQYLGYSSLALKNYKKAESVFHSIGNLKGEVDTKINRASIYLIEGKYQESEELLLEMEHQSSSLGFTDSRSTTYLNLAHLYKKMDRTDVLQYYLKAYQYGKKSGKVNTQIEGALGVLENHLKEGKVKQARQTTEELDSLILKKERQYYFPEYYDLKASLARLEKNFEKAFSYSQKAIIFRDKLYANSEKARELFTSLEIANEEKKVLSEKLKRKDAENKTVKFILLALIVLVLLLIVIIFFARRNLQMKREQKVSELNFESKISDILYQSELKFLENGLELRKKIGRDLHDHLGSKLAVAQMRIDSLALNDFDLNSKELKEISTILENSCVDLRSISHDLVDEQKTKGALNQAIEVLCASIPQDENFLIQFNTIGNPHEIPLIVKRNLIATISLLMDNILKHSKATKVDLQIFHHMETINIELEDNGIGFDIHKKASGIGLKNAFSRIEVIHGTIEINSKKSFGTFISIAIPIKEKQ